MAYLDNLSLDPSNAEAGATILLTLRMRISRDLPPNGMILMDCPGYLGATRPQFLYSENEGFVVVNASDPDLRWKGGITNLTRSRWLFAGADYQGLDEKSRRPFRHIALIFPAGAPPDTSLSVQIGGEGGGFTTGYKVGTVAPRPGFRHRFIVRLYAAPDAAAPLESHDLFQTVRAQPPASARVIRHATGSTALLFRDMFGNPSPTADPRALVRVSAPMTPNDHGVWECRGMAKVGPARIPLADSAEMADVEAGYSIFWGDLHTHSALSCDCRNAERSEMQPADMFAFGRRGARLDFMALTDHNHHNRGPDQALTREEWAQAVEAADAADAPGEFAALAGMEYGCVRGDTVALFGRTPDYDLISRAEDEPIPRFWRAAAEADVLTIPHFHNPGTLPEGEWLYPEDRRVDPVVEVFSCHGRYDAPYYDGMPMGPPRIKAVRRDRNGEWLLARGYRYGICANSDDHKGRPGMLGLTALFLKSLTRAGVLDALRARRCYGTTGARIRLLFSVDGRIMGSELGPVERGRVRVQVRGTATLRTVEVLRNGALHRRIDVSGSQAEAEWDEPFGPGATRLQVRVLQADQEMAFSSPIWVDNAEG